MGGETYLLTMVRYQLSGFPFRTWPHASHANPCWAVLAARSAAPSPSPLLFLLLLLLSAMNHRWPRNVPRDASQSTILGQVMRTSGAVLES